MRTLMLLLVSFISHVLLAEQFPIQCHVWGFDGKNLVIEKQISYVIDSKYKNYVIQEIGGIYKAEIRSNRDDFRFSLITEDHFISTAATRTERVAEASPGTTIFGTITVYPQPEQQQIRIVYSCSKEVLPPR